MEFQRFDYGAQENIQRYGQVRTVKQRKINLGFMQIVRKGELALKSLIGNWKTHGIQPLVETHVSFKTKQ